MLVSDFTLAKALEMPHFLTLRPNLGSCPAMGPNFGKDPPPFGPLLSKRGGSFPTLNSLGPYPTHMHLNQPVRAVDFSFESTIFNDTIMIRGLCHWPQVQTQYLTNLQLNFSFQNKFL